MEQSDFFYERPMDSRKQTPYEVLGIPNNSDEAAIKAAYHKLAKKWHPDKNPNNSEESTKKFKGIVEAYEQLTKETNYEVNGFEELFSDLFGELFKKKSTNLSVIKEINLTLEELYTGTEKVITYNKKIINPNKKNSICDRCKGSGVVSIIEKLSAMMLSQRMDKCPNCSGKGYFGELITITENKTINILPGTPCNEKIIFTNEGNQQLDNTIGDLVIQTITQDHLVYTRKNNDLYILLNITFKEAMLGCEKIIEQLDGKKIKLNFKGPIRFGKIKKIPNKGMPINDSYGDLFIEFNFNLPKKLTIEQKDCISKLFN